MKRLLVIFFLLFATNAFASFSVVQQSATGTGGASTISATITGTTSGNSLVITVTATGGLTIGSPAVSGETLVCGTEQDQTGASPNSHTQLCYIKSLSSSGSKTFTDTNVHLSWGVQFFEISGADTTTFKDVDGGSISGTPSTSFSYSLTTTAASDAIFTIITNDQATTLVPPGTPSGYTAATTQDASGGGNWTFYNLNVGAAGSKTISSSQGVNSNWTSNAIAILLPAGPPPASSVRHRRVQ